MGDQVAGLPEGTFSGSIDFQNAFALGGQRRPPAFSHAAAVNIPSVPGFPPISLRNFWLRDRFA